MPSTELLIAFFVTTAIFAYIPGPAMLYAAAQTIARGRWSGLMATLGIHLGCYVHVMAAAAGLSVLFHAVPVLYLVVKLAGAAYLVWLGISMLRAKAEGGDAALPALEAKSGRRAFLESITVEVLNPKTALFFLAFLPQFIAVDEPHPLARMVELSGVFMAMTFAVFAVYGLFAASVRDRVITRPKVMAWLRRSFAAGFALLGAKLAFAER